MPGPAAPPLQRRHDLDWVRVLAFGVLVLYHVGMYYVSWGWHVKSVHAGTALEPWMLLTAPWRMSLLFLVSGAATAFMLRRQPLVGLGERSRRLLLPLLFGMLVVVVPQSYFQVVEQLPGGYHEGYGAFYLRYLGGDRGFCGSDGKCLQLPTWNHLWFLPYLWVYTALLWAARRWMPVAARAQVHAAVAGACRGWRALWLPAALLAAARLLLVGRFEQTHALVDDWYNHAQYLPMFLLGYLCAFESGFWETLRRQRWLALGIALACWVLTVKVWYFSGYSGDASPPEPLRLALRAAWGMGQWCGVAAALGFAQRLRGADNAVLRYLVPAVFPVYILHQTLIITLAHAFKPLALPALPEGLLLVVLTLCLAFAGYELVRRIVPLRPLFGLSRHAAAR